MKKFRALIAVLVASLLFACGSPAANKDDKATTDVAKDGGVLRVALAANVVSLDPVKYTSVYESNVMRSIYNTLIEYDMTNSKFLPAIAKEWKVSDDLLTYTFVLRDDISFQKSDYQAGRKVVAEDVKYSLMRSLNESKLKRLRNVKEVVVKGDHEVAVVLDQPYAAFLTMLTDLGNAIVAKEDIEGYGDNFAKHPIGTGAFAFKDWKADSYVELQRNETYFGNKPHLDGVIFSFITDPNQMSNALLAGDIDIATVVKGPNVEIIQKDDRFELTNINGLSIGYMGLNMKDGPTANLKVRQAMNYALNRDEIIAGVYRYNEAVPQYLPLPPASWGYSEKAAEIVKKSSGGDIEKAKALLAEAGYANGFDLELYCSAARQPQATIVQAQMAKIGINISIKTLEWGAFSETVSKGNAQSYIMGWNWHVDPDFYLYQMLATKQIGTLGNGGQYSNEKVDQLLNDATSKLTDQDARKAKYEEALLEIVNDLPHLDLYNEKSIHGVSKNVQGFVPTANQSLYFTNSEVNVWLKEAK